MTNFANFEDREEILEDDAMRLQSEGSLAMDPERALPLWFDGRYLTARDLNREQYYFLARQSAIGKAVGRGVIEGLEVSVDGQNSFAGTRLTINAGQGIAFDGAHIILPQDLQVNLADLSVQDALNARLGLSQNPGASIRSRTGIFALSLRAVEYTANQTASFPTHVTGERSTHMGDRIEAVAVSLTPYAPIDAPFDSAEARAMATQRIFQAMQEVGTPGHALPLALIALRNGTVEWLDMHLARRDLVASRREFLGMGLSRDQLRLAHFNQYQSALSDVIDSYVKGGQPARFNAEQHFRILPAAGPMPAACVDPAAQTQIFFPGEIEVELSIIPDDELPSLVDDSFELPPIDLSRPIEDRDSLSVMILAPLPREAMRRTLRHLGALQRPLKPISLIGQGPQKPIDKLGTIRIALADVAAALDDENTPTTNAWAGVISDLTSFGSGGDAVAPMLWYVRRRTLRENAELESALGPVDHIDVGGGGEVIDVEDPVDEGGSTTPEPKPEPKPRPKPELTEDQRRALLQLAGFGDLAKIAEAQFRRVDDKVDAIYIDGLRVPQIRGFPLSVTALTIRIAELKPNDAEGAKKAMESLAAADVQGLRIMGAALLGEGSVRITETRFKELQFFAGKIGMLEETSIAIRKIGVEQAKKPLIELREAIRSGSEDAVQEVTKQIISMSEKPKPTPIREEPDKPKPQPGPSAAEIAAQKKKEEAERKAKADALIRQVKDRNQQKQLGSLFNSANSTARDALVRKLDAANFERSRIAVGNVIARIGPRTKLQTSHLSRVNHVNANFVTGIAVLEPMLLAPPKVKAPPKQPVKRPAKQPARQPAKRKLAAKKPAARSRSAALAASRANALKVAGPQFVAQPKINPDLLKELVKISPAAVVNKRLQLLSSNGSLRTLAAAGFKHRTKKTNLRKMADIVVKALDNPKANAGTVTKAIIAATRSVK